MSKKPKKTKQPRATSSGNTGVGRPPYVPTFPAVRAWTFQQFMDACHARDIASKRSKVSTVTLRSYLATDAKRGSKSLVVRNKETRKPNNSTGRGRPQMLYTLRSKLAPKQSEPEQDAPPIASVSVGQDTSSAVVAPATNVPTETSVQEPVVSVQESIVTDATQPVAA